MIRSSIRNIFASLSLLTVLATGVTSCSGDADFTYSSLPARFVFENVFQAPVLNVACNSMGEFCSITSDGKQFIFKGSSREPSYVPLTAINGYSGFYLGLSGLIVGLPDRPEMGKTESQVVCFDLACPNCYRDYNITKPLVLQAGGNATCNSCKRTYELNNAGYCPTGKKLERYRVSFLNNTLVVSNR